MEAHEGIFVGIWELTLDILLRTYHLEQYC